MVHSYRFETDRIADELHEAALEVPIRQCRLCGKMFSIEDYDEITKDGVNYSGICADCQTEVEQ